MRKSGKDSFSKKNPILNLNINLHGIEISRIRLIEWISTHVEHGISSNLALSSEDETPILKIPVKVIVFRYFSDSSFV